MTPGMIKDMLIEMANDNGYITVRQGCKDFLRMKGIDPTRREIRRPLSSKQKGELYLKQNGLCRRCGAEMTLKEATDDHINPIAQGGLNDLKNRRLICDPCNRQKGAADQTAESKRGFAPFDSPPTQPTT
jgi:5-methylcytosine-specific restriction endonuclease McrA